MEVLTVILLSTLFMVHSEYKKDFVHFKWGDGSRIII